MKNHQTSYYNWIEKQLSNSRIDYTKFSFNNNNIGMFILRDDLIHPFASGNKLTKLKYNILEACKENCFGIVTYGGAFSNHLLACATVGMELEIPMTLMVRGNELNTNSNGILKKCSDLGASIIFLSREDYKRKKYESGIIFINKTKYWSIPEGGSNIFGVIGCGEMVNLINQVETFDNILISTGSGTTLSGIYSKISSNVNFFVNNITSQFNIIDHINEKFNLKIDPSRIQGLNSISISNLKFGKIDQSILNFVNSFNSKNYDFKLDPIYTGKLMYLFLKNYVQKQVDFSNKYLFVHTGGVNQELW